MAGKQLIYEGGTMSKFTPGPWKAVHRSVSEQIDCFEIADVSEMRIIPKSGGWPKNGSPEDDANFIASAPEMYEELCELVAAIGECGLTERARALIARIDGETK